ncbi:mediator of RNA polymerase II transcription subunit 30 [Drosophila grimshawi]|uniref:Mediator of RNA polymerase II transcription subunit 30 n=1 Tax=Drosophila grimshawi TaxID=7222 RepID=B4J2S7_DROGR|nr:mediator of RNA polymerase II transcription subunit 30 [Drosophila grimshawi]EDV96068.1 GH16043 [Drosophila grimshawi]
MWKYSQNQLNQGPPGGGAGGGGGGGGPNMMPMGGGFMQGGAGMHMSPQQQQHQMNMMGGPGGGPGSMQMNPNASGPPGLMQSMGMSPQHQMQQQQMMQGGVGVPMSNMPQQQQMMGPQQGVGMVPGPQQHPPNMPQQQQQQQHNPGAGAAGGPGGGNNMLAISQPNPHKEINIVQLSRLGQETVQDIASRFQEVFSALKNIQPTSHRDNNTEKKVQEYFRTIRLLFKRVRIIYEKCNDAGMDYMNAESLIPYRDEPDPRIEPSQCDEYRKVLQENQELIETVKLKNRQLREIIDRTRIIIWEINTMLAMRRS